MAKATTTIKQALHYQPQQAAWFAANQLLFNQVAAFYFDVIQAHEKVLALGKQEALCALERLTHPATTPTRSCLSPPSERTSRPCFAAPPSMPPWVLPDPSLLTSSAGEPANRRLSPVAKRSPIARQCHLVPGTRLCPFMRKVGKSARQTARKPSISQVRHADHHELGTAQEGMLRMDEPPSSMPTQLRLFAE